MIAPWYAPKRNRFNQGKRSGDTSALLARPGLAFESPILGGFDLISELPIGNSEALRCVCRRGFPKENGDRCSVLPLVDLRFQLTSDDVVLIDRYCLLNDLGSMPRYREGMRSQSIFPGF